MSHLKKRDTCTLAGNGLYVDVKLILDTVRFHQISHICTYIEYIISSVYQFIIVDNFEFHCYKFEIALRNDVAKIV